MNILVTGGAGFIGSHIAGRYLKEGHKVIVVDNLSTGLIENVNPNSKFYKLDISRDDLSEIFENYKIDVVNHHAAQIDLRKSLEDPVFDMKVNIEGSLKLFEASVKNNIKKIIFASSGGAVYGEQISYPANEQHPVNPISPYGISKLTVEKYLKFYADKYNIKTICFRYSNVYGPAQNPKGEAGVISIFCQKILKGQQPYINGDGEQTRDFVFVKDVVNANLLALDYENSDVFNISTNSETSVNRIFDIINGRFGNKYKKIKNPGIFGEVKRSLIDNNKAINFLKWKPVFNIDEGLEITCEWFRNNISN
jgi:UDP-glucose 4-epimerase